MRIDPHVHCRDGLESYKETIAHVFQLCDRQGVDVIFDMPNTNPPLLGAQELEQRLKYVPQTARDRYKTFVAATSDSEQLRQAVALTAENPDTVIGLKLYAGQSVGTLSVPLEMRQLEIYRNLSDLGYTGVLAVHCEKEIYFKDLFDPARPASHSEARPAKAEEASIRDQVEFARLAKFKGTVHICHLSSALGLEAIKEIRHHPDYTGIKVTCGVTPHHLLWSDAQTRTPAGLLYKINPPLRLPSDNVALRAALKSGVIDWIETDHAPHPLCEKLYPPYASGFPSLCLYQHLVEKLLPAWGLNSVSIYNLTCANIIKTFKMKAIL